jgi:hypothetical protein
MERKISSTKRVLIKKTKTKQMPEDGKYVETDCSTEKGKNASPKQKERRNILQWGLQETLNPASVHKESRYRT